jgi:hypothetical protein
VVFWRETAGYSAFTPVIEVGSHDFWLEKWSNPLIIFRNFQSDYFLLNLTFSSLQSRQTPKFNDVKLVMQNLLTFRRQLMSSALHTQEQKRAIKAQIVSKIDWING